MIVRGWRHAICIVMGGSLMAQDLSATELPNTIEELCTQIRESTGQARPDRPQLLTRSREVGRTFVNLAGRDVPGYSQLLEQWNQACLELEMPPSERLGLVEQIAAALARSNGVQRGRGVALRILTRDAFGVQAGQSMVARWCDWYDRQPAGPRRIWIATTVARNLINLCGDFAGGERVLTDALRQLEGLKPWSRATARESCKDRDIYMTMPDRDEAGSWHDARGGLLLLRGFARIQLGDTISAIADLEAARPPLKRTGNLHRLVNIGDNLASARLQLGDWDGALAIAEQTEQGYREAPWEDTGRADRNGVEAMLHIQARILLERGETEDEANAVKLLRGVLQRIRPLLSETNGEATFTLLDALLRGAALPEAGELDRLFDVARGIATRSPATAAEYDVLLARRHIGDGDWQAARDAASRAVARCDGHRLPHLVVRAELVLAEVAVHEQRSDVALRAYHRAADELLRTVADQQLWRRHGSAQVFLRRFDLILKGALTVVRRRTADPGVTAKDLADLYSLLQKFRGFESWCWVRLARMVREQADVDVADPAGGGNRREDMTTLRAEQKRLLRERAELEAKPHREPRGYYLRLRRLRRNADSLNQLSFRMAQLQRRALPQLGALIGEPPSLAQVQACLDGDELLLECAELGREAVVFVVRRDAVALRSLPVGSGWRGAVAGWRAWCRSGSDERDPDKVDELRGIEQLLLPAGGWLTAELESCRRLLWSPVGSFCDVPVAALRIGDRRFCEQACIRHVVSGSVLAFYRGRSVVAGGRAGARLLALGNPRYPQQAVRRAVLRSLVPGGGFKSLPATSHEVLEIARLFASPDERRRVLGVDAPEHFDGELAGDRFRVLLGTAATKQALTPQVLAAANVLHFACHGRNDKLAPGQSFLALSLNQDERAGDTDELLRLSELCRMRGDFELVALSACDTASGVTPAQASSLSLAWAARMAGARRVLATGWPLSDGGARRLFVAFYTKWMRDLSRADEALRQAQVAAIAELPVRDWASLQLWGGGR